MSIWCDNLAGWAAGVSSVVVGHPLDTIKVRQQSLDSIGAINVAKYTFKYEGFFAFYKGMLFPLISAGILNSVFFGVYGATRRMFINKNVAEFDITKNLKSKDLEVFCSGCLGGLAQVFITCPVDLIKIKLQTETGNNEKLGGGHKHSYRGSLDCLRKVYRDTGLRGCFKGLAVTTLRDVPSSGIYILLYEKLLSWHHKGNVHSDLSFLPTLYAGGVAGIVSWASVIPLDVVKSRIQADDIQSPKYSGIIDCFKQSYREGGWRIFGTGFWVICLRAFPVNAIAFMSYEFVMCYLCPL